MRTLEEITMALEPEAVRKALGDKLEQVKAMLADKVVTRQLEANNPTLTPEYREQLMGQLEKEIVGLDEIREEIEERLSTEVLMAPNREARRNGSK